MAPLPVTHRAENAFVIGYGLDYQSKLRNLPFIGVNVGDGPPYG